MMKRLFLITFCLCFVMQTIHAEIVKPVFKQLKDPNLDGEDNEPSTSGIAITPDGKKFFVMDNLEAGATDGGAIFIYDLTTAFDISTMDVQNRTIVDTTGLGDDLGFGNGKKTIVFNNDGKKLFLFNTHGLAQFHNLASPYDVASISASTLIPDDGLNYKTAYNSGALEISALYGVTFNNDGTRMYLNDGHKNVTDITQVNLSTPFDPSSGTFAFNLNTEDIPDLRVNGFTFEIAFDDDGTRLYISEGLNNSTGAPTFMFVYKLSTPFELSSATYVGASQIVGNGNNVSAIGWTFGNNGMKAYIGTEDANADGDDIIYEYDLTCPYGIVLCETDAVTAIGAQVEIAKNVIHQNSSTIFKRFDWLRRNDERANFTNHEVKLNIHNPILAALKTNFENSLNNIQLTQASLKKENSSKNKKNWSHWSHGDFSIGRVGDTATSKPKEVKTKGFMYGLDKLVDNKIFGYAFRYGKDEVDLEDGSNTESDVHTFSLNIYSSVPLKSQSNLNLLFGVSYLMLDQLDKNNRESGSRNGKQIYTSIGYENENAYTKYELIPFGKFEMGITKFSDYTNFDVISNNIENHERLTFRTGNVSAGLKFDNILYLNDKTYSRNGFIEYIYDLTPDINHYVRSHIDNVTLKKTIKTHSLHNIKGNIGYEYMNSNGSTIAINYERFQSLDEPGHKDSLLIKIGRAKKQNADFDVIYDPINNNKTEISYLKNLGNFKLKLNSNYSLFSKIPDYGANIELSGTF